MIASASLFIRGRRKNLSRSAAFRAKSGILWLSVFGLRERWRWEPKFLHDIRSVNSSVP